MNHQSWIAAESAWKMGVWRRSYSGKAWQSDFAHFQKIICESKRFQDQAVRPFSNGTWAGGGVFCGKLSPFKVKQERKCVSSSAFAVKSSLSGRFWIWPLWLSASFSARFWTANLGSLCAIQSVITKCALTQADCVPGLPGYFAREPLGQLDFRSLWTIFSFCVQKRVSSDLFCLPAGSSPLWGHTEAAFFQSVCSCQLILKWILWIFVLWISEFQWWN